VGQRFGFSTICWSTTVELLEKFPEILHRWQELFRYILIDEIIKDTNTVQYRLVKLLAQKYQKHLWWWVTISNQFILFGELILKHFGL